MIDMKKQNIIIANISEVSEVNSNDFNNDNDSGASQENTSIILEEKDFPGAALLRPLEQCSVAILKRWLFCCGAWVSGRKNELAQR